MSCCCEPVMLQGSERRDDYIDIFMEFVPGGSIAKMVADFGGALLAVSTVTRPLQSHPIH